MSILDEVTGRVKSALGEKAPGATGLLTVVMEYVNRPDVGGIQGLIQKFEKAGLGTQIQSWLGTGKKLPVSPDEITRALGSADVAGIATKAGISPEQASQQLSTLLPDEIGKLAPGGQPGVGAFGEIVGAVKEKIGI